MVLIGLEGIFINLISQEAPFFFSNRRRQGKRTIENKGLNVLLIHLKGSLATLNLGIQTNRQMMWFFFHLVAFSLVL